MEAKIVNLRTLFEQQVSYKIPQFQRPYAWKKDIQWQPLWNDIRSVAQRILNQDDNGKIRSHFMGAIVLQQQKSNTGEVTKRLVVDGQQRLTTLQLFIKAAEQVFQSQDDTTRADRLRELTANQRSHWGEDSDNETKIRQSNLSDQKAFQTAIRSHYSEDHNQPSIINQAYRFLKIAAGEWLNNQPEKRTAKADALEETLTRYLEIAVIDLDEDEKPHIIFETLNARGEPLEQSDLIKNTIMYEADVVDDASKARDLWGMFDDEWWRKDTSETQKRMQIDRFLNCWMMMRKIKNVKKEEVASEFRSYIEEKNHENQQSTIDIITKEIKLAGTIYQDIEETRVPEFSTFLKRMKALGLGVITPLVLWLFTSEVPQERLRRSIDVLESYVVRRTLSGLPTAGLNRFFISLLEKLESSHSSHADRTIINYLKSQTADNQVWPQDWMLRDALAGPMKGKGMIARRKMVLEAIEVNLRSDKSEPLGSTDGLTVEHVMPVQWQQHWPLPVPANGSPEDEVLRIRSDAIESIGNLTLTTSKLNSKLSNGPWTKKREALMNHSSLFLNKTLLNNAPNVWDEAAIERRCLFFAENILEIWPYADSFDESDA